MKKNIHTYQQEGFVSIIVTMFIMIVLTLIVLGFAQLARREQRQALDRQLSTQALFAAESGVNDAINKVKDGFHGELNTCAESATVPVPYTFNSNLSATTSYSCLLLKQNQDTLLYDSINTDNSTFIPIDSGAVTLNRITIGWGKTATAVAGNIPVPLLSKFPPVTSWPATGLGVLRVDIVPTDGTLFPISYKTGSITSTFFFYPSTGVVGSIPISSTAGTIVGGNCGAAGPTSQPCNVTITGLSGTKYFIRIKSIYHPSSLVVCVNSCGSGGIPPTPLFGAQLSIDVTGKAQDVIKRISVRAPAPVTNTTPGSLPEFALDSMDSICKLLTVMPNPAAASGVGNSSSFGTCP